jgi:anti-anti-sigma factor
MTTRADAAEMPMVVRIHRQDGDVVATVAGELDVSNVLELRRMLLAEVGRRPHRLIVDLAAVPFCDLAGVRMFIDVATLARENGAELTLTAVPWTVDRIVEVLDLGRELPIVRQPRARG